MLVNVPNINNGDDATPDALNSRFGAITDALNGNIDADNLADNAVTSSKIPNGAVTSEKMAAQQGFIAPTFQNNWSDYDATHQSAGYMKDSLGFVHLRGLVKNTNTGVITSIVFTLPAGYRPSKVEHFPLAQAATSHSGHVRIDAGNGEVSVSGSGSWCSLAGITFKAA